MPKIRNVHLSPIEITQLVIYGKVVYRISVDTDRIIIDEVPNNMEIISEHKAKAYIDASLGLHQKEET